MQTILESVPQSGQVQVNISVTATMNISAYAARHKVNAFVMNEISYMLHSTQPKLVVADRLFWRVPVVLSLKSRGDVGEVGTIDVDVETGQMRVDHKVIEEIDARAEALASHSAS